MSRAQPLAMDNSYALELTMQRLCEEVAQCHLRLGDCQPMEIDLGLHPVLSAAKLPQYRHLHAVAGVDEFIAGGELRITGLPVETLKQHRVSIRATEARHRHRTAAARDRRHFTPGSRLTSCTASLNSRTSSSSSGVGLTLPPPKVVPVQYSSRLQEPPRPQTIPSRSTPTVKILVSNDDGFRAEGIRRLREALATLADVTVTVMAPDRNRSGASNSLTLDVPLRVFEAEPGVYYVPGTPTDCVHLAVSGYFDHEYDMVVSGVNDGPNLGDDVLYSGTVAAAIEGRFLGLPTIAVSLPPHRAAATTSRPAPPWRGFSLRNFRASRWNVMVR